MKITVTEEMREALDRMRARDAEARDTQRTEGERRLSMVYRGWAASDLARLVDEAVEQADREEIRRIALSPGPCFNDDCQGWSVEGSPFCAECEPPTQIPEAPEAWADVTDEDLDAALRDLRGREEPPPCGAILVPADISECRLPSGHDGPHRGEARGEHRGQVEWDRREARDADPA